VKVLSFDVYGTLVDVRAGSHAAFADILTSVGAPHLDPLEFWERWEAANIRRYWQPYRPYRQICRESLAETFDHFGLRGDAGLIERYFDAFPRFRRFDDVDGVLDKLSRRFTLALVSNIDDDLLAATPLGRTFDLVCTAERARGYKPDGTLFRYLLKVAAVEVSDLVHSGQSQRTDMVGAKPLGITVAWINRRAVPLAADVPKPDHQFSDLRPLLELLGG
jgi:2-haloacid dehalogenase